MTFAAFCHDYLLLVAIACTLAGLAGGALLEWLWMRWRWAASGATFPQWWRVDLGAAHNLSQVTINWFTAATMIDTVATFESRLPSFALNVKLSGPL